MRKARYVNTITAISPLYEIHLQALDAKKWKWHWHGDKKPDTNEDVYRNYEDPSPNPGWQCRRKRKHSSSKNKRKERWKKSRMDG
jgi:hypothetical protein